MSRNSYGVPASPPSSLHGYSHVSDHGNGIPLPQGPLGEAYLNATSPAKALSNSSRTASARNAGTLASFGSRHLSSSETDVFNEQRSQTNGALQEHPLDTLPTMWDTSSTSERGTGNGSVSARSSRQQTMDQWCLDQRRPVTKQDVVTPVKAYVPRSNSSQGGSPVRAPKPPSTPTPRNEPVPAIQNVGALFNFDPFANLGPKLPPSGALPQPLPEWTRQRMYLTGQFLSQSITEREKVYDMSQPLNTMDRGLQDRIVVDDLLHAFLGLDGKYIRAHLVKRTQGEQIVFAVEGPMDHSIREMAARMLPLCEYVAITERFVETRSTYEWGLVCQAVAGAMRSLLEDWRLLVTQLEHQHLIGQLNLPTLWYHCQRPLTSLQLVASLAADAAANKLRGGALLNLLHERSAAVAGDVQATHLLQKLMQEACKPYFYMLELWLCQGVLEDPYSEFMVEEKKDVGQDSLDKDDTSAYWTERYCLREKDTDVYASSSKAENCVPKILEGCKKIILTTGKYLNLIRECGRQVVRPLDPGVHIVYDAEESYVQHIQSANKAASTALLKLMQNELGLPSLLLALKHYFLMDRGDLLMTFLDTAEDEMGKKLSSGSLPRLQTLLDLAVRSSEAHDKFSEELLCTIDMRRLLPMLSAFGRNKAKEEDVQLATLLGREVFMLDLKVPWPLNVVIHSHAKQAYQMIFRHLFELKCVERELNDIWRVYQTTRAAVRGTHEGLRRAYGVCQRMMHFFHQLQLYMEIEVLEPLWRNMQNEMRNAATLDAVISVHAEFIRQAVHSSLLSSKVVRYLSDLKVLVYKFSRLSHHLEVPPDNFEQDSLDEYGRAKSETQLRRERQAWGAETVQAMVDNTTFSDKTRALEGTFNAKLKDFMGGLLELLNPSKSPKTKVKILKREERESLLNLIMRLDFNDYFANTNKSMNLAASLQGPMPRLDF